MLTEDDSTGEVLPQKRHDHPKAWSMEHPCSSEGYVAVYGGTVRKRGTEDRALPVRQR